MWRNLPLTLTLVKAGFLITALGTTFFVTPVSAEPPSHIADLWYAHNAVVVMLGAADRIAVTVARPASMPWMYRVAPALRKATVVEAGSPNIETLLAAHVDLAFVSQDSEADRLRALDIHTLQVSFTDLPSLRDCLHRTSEAIGTETARQRAGDYDTYLDGVISELRAGLENLPEANKPRVLHIASLTPLRVDGNDTIIDEWIRLAGGRNAATGLRGNLQPVSMEQVASWQPDLIIIGGSAGNPASDSIWANISAVRNGHVVRNPTGVFPWDRYGTEFALQLQWTAKLLHPDLFPGTDMTLRTIAFYHRFFGYEMPVTEALLVLAAQSPPLN